jgi:hypothetical protein
MTNEFIEKARMQACMQAGVYGWMTSILLGVWNGFAGPLDGACLRANELTSEMV